MAKGNRIDCFPRYKENWTDHAEFPVARCHPQDLQQNSGFSLFCNAFPDAHDVPTLITEFLVSAVAESTEEGAVDVHERLVADAEYMAQMHVLVSPLTLNIALLTML